MPFGSVSTEDMMQQNETVQSHSVSTLLQ